MLILPGSDALSAFRTHRLLQQLHQIDSAIAGVNARYLHFIDAPTPPSAADERVLAGLLTYGEPFEGSEDGEAFVVIPRFGTISPWASKATDIARNCGLQHIRRIERGIRYTVHMKAGLLGGEKKLSQDAVEQIQALLHDRMTETVLRSADQAAGLFGELEAQ